MSEPTALRARAGTLRGAVPGWLGRSLRAARAPFPRAAAVRGALAVSVPLMVGLLAGHPVAGVVVGLGGLWAVGQERRVARAEQGCDAITAYVVAGGRR
ncbi:hypothetical protein OH717_09535 [Streptomyces albidoflavus]|nr:hypothetical protein OH717_09535 [Streptomyces albidoflavus]